jgi:hypothetical protein
VSLADGLEPGVHLHVVREDPAKRDLLYLGTEHGVAYSPDGGNTWEPLKLNLPTVPVHDLVVKDADLVVGTHGRSVWILDDLTPLRELTDAIKEKADHLFTVRPATRWLVGARPVSSHLRGASAPNPAYGAVVWYHLAKEPTAAVRLEVLDAKGTVVAVAKRDAKKPEKKEVSGEEVERGETDEDEDHKAPDRKLEAKPGLNRFVWDLTHDGAKPIPGAKVDSGNPAAGVPVAPGKYTLKLTVGTRAQTQTVEVMPDPRPTPTPDLAAQEQLALQVRDDITKLSAAVARIRALKKQLDLRKDLLKDNAGAKEVLKLDAALAAKLDALEGKLHNPKAKVTYDIFAARGGAMLYSQLTWLLTNLTDADGIPTQAQRDLAADLRKQLAGHRAALDTIVKEDVAKLNDTGKAVGVPGLYVPPGKTEAGGNPPG